MLVSIALGGAPGAQAQELTLGDRAPRFLVNAPAGPAPVDVQRTAVLRRRISLDLRDVTLAEALDAIARQSGLRLGYSRMAVPVDRVVRLVAEDITVAGALSTVLLDTGVDVLFERDGQAAIVRRGTLPAVGTVRGRVTDARTQQGVSGVRVFLERTRWGTTTDSAGGYRLTQIDPGAYTLVTRRIGYRPHTQPVTVEADRETTVDVALQPAPSDLEAVVVTATGEQRLLELGHVVGQINADSLVRAAPVSSLSELLTGRVPGLQVFQKQGTVGGRVTLQVRGPNSLSLSNQPIVIIDGVRYTTQERPSLFSSSSLEPSSPLNDLNLNDLESIEVIKGPSAATLYGTDAANGVIVVTTKRGRPGPARWNAYARATATSVAQHFEDKYWGWGTVNGVPNNPRSSCTLDRLASGECTQQDSVTVLPNALNDPEYTIFRSKPSWEYGMNLSGGERDLRYYFSADFEDATGPVQMPRAIAERLRQQRGTEVPEEWREPNALTKLNLRSNLTATIANKVDLGLTLGYVRNATRALSETSNPYWAAHWRATPAATSPYSSGVTRDDPANGYSQTVTERTDRFVGSANGQWRPAAWLATRATLGLDASYSQRSFLARPGDQPGISSTRNGVVEDTRSRQMATSADLGVTATARRGRVSARTAIGAQYVRSLYTASGTFGAGLPAGGSAVQQALIVLAHLQHLETAVLGGYAEEMLGVNDRLFLTAALRVDGASTFGREFQASVYPKVGASWLLSEEPFLPRLPGLNELRLRYAFGASGQQPAPAAARVGLTATQIVLNGRPVHAVDVRGLGNPDLRPERVREHEFGFDATALASRVTVNFTWFRRRTVDQLVSQNMPVGLGSIMTNLGLTTQRGFEAQLRARVMETRMVSWDLTLQHADFTTKLVDAAGTEEVRLRSGGYVEGYPLGARFDTPVLGWADVNGDGIIDFSELQLGDTTVYQGQVTPPRNQVLTSVLGFFDRRLRLSAVLERKSGFTQSNALRCVQGSCRAAVDPNTPLAAQAEASAYAFEKFIPEKGDFTRLREVSVALDLPARLTRALRLGEITVVVSGRNLALWSAFSGPDPEVGRFQTSAINATGLTGQQVDAMPLGRVFSVRLDIGL